MRKLIILDRDGVINFDSDDYIKSADEWIPIPGSIEAIAILKKKGYTVAVASNQSGLARGFFKQSDLEAMHNKMISALAAKGAALDDLQYCPHGPDDGCLCRKPKPGMILKILEKTGFQADEEVLFIGDSLSDLQAAKAAGIGSVLVKTGKGEKTLVKIRGTEFENVPVYLDLKDAVQHIVNAC